MTASLLLGGLRLLSSPSLSSTFGLNIRVELVPVLSNGELLVIVNRNVNLLRADNFSCWLMELSHKWVFQTLLSGHSFIRIECQQTFDEINGFI